MVGFFSITFFPMTVAAVLNSLSVYYECKAVRPCTAVVEDTPDSALFEANSELYLFFTASAASSINLDAI